MTENKLNPIWNYFEKIIKIFVYKIASIIHVDIDQKRWNDLIQFIKFGIVGVSNTFISYITYVIVCLIGFNFHIGNIVGFIVSVLNSFYWNNKYVFKNGIGEERLWWKSLVKTFISYAFSGLILVEILSIIWIQYFNISKFISPFLNMVVTIPINFIMNKVWAFKSTKK